jgi:selenocysteine lyase/cysteine desulfurase
MLLDMTARRLDVLLRASVHYYNADEEIERLCAALADL